MLRHFFNDFMTFVPLQLPQLLAETADKNTFAGALAQESSHYVTLGYSTIRAFICQQFFP